jgi:hypothetical protein
MRTFALLILFVNLGYLVWNHLRQSENGAEYAADQSHFIPADQSLILLSELPPLPALPAGDEALSISEQQALIPSEPEIQDDESSSIVPAQADESELYCEIVSGFVDQDEAESFIGELSNMGVLGELDMRQEQISSTWWVHLPPFKSQLEAQDVIDELVAKNIDNFYMRTGELAGGISLGVFSREESATTAQAELSARGYETSIKEIPRYVSKAYVTLEVTDADALGTEEWLDFLATKPDLETTEKLCETIAR